MIVVELNVAVCIAKMVRTRNSVRKKTKTPIKKKSTPKIATNKVDRKKIERCKQWLTQQKREKGRVQSQPIDALESDASGDEDELCVLRLNEATLVSAKDDNFGNISQTNFVLGVDISRSIHCQRMQKR